MKQVAEFPYSQLRLKPTKNDFVKEVFVGKELANEAFTYLTPQIPIFFGLLQSSVVCAVTPAQGFSSDKCGQYRPDIFPFKGFFL